MKGRSVENQYLIVEYRHHLFISENKGLIQETLLGTRVSLFPTQPGTDMITMLFYMYFLVRKAIKMKMHIHLGY